MECERFRCPLFNNWQYILERSISGDTVHMLTVCQKTGKYGVYTAASDGVFFKGWFAEENIALNHYIKVAL